jgi:hypothetical protein
MTTQTDETQDTQTLRAQWLGKTLQADGVEFARTNGWETLAEHIEVHRYFLGQNLTMPVTWQQAMFSWYDTIFPELKRAADSWIVRAAFPKQENGDLILAVSDHWHYLKEHDENATVQDAARSFVEHYGNGIARLFSRFIVND